MDINLTYDVRTSALTAEGVPIAGVKLTARTVPTLWLTITSGGAIVDLSSVQNWRAAADVDFDVMTPPAARTISGFVTSLASGGVIGVPLDLRTSSLATILGKEAARDGRMEVWGYNSLSSGAEPTKYFTCPVRFMNVVDPAGGDVPPDYSSLQDYAIVIEAIRPTVSALDSRVSALESGGGGGGDLPGRVTALESGAVVMSGAISDLDDTVTSMGGIVEDLDVWRGDVEGDISEIPTISATASYASTTVANLSGSVETLSGWAYNGGSSAHIINETDGAFVIRDGAVISSAYLEGGEDNHSYISGGTVKKLQLENGDGVGVATQYSGVVSALGINGSYGGETPTYYISGGSLLFATVKGALIIRGGAICSTYIEGGTATVSSGATLSNITLNGGTLSCVSGGTAYGIHFISGTYISGGTTIFEED